MKQIGSLFDRYRSILRPPQATVEREAAKVIEATVGIAVADEMLTYNPRSRTLTLQVPAIIRTEVVRNKAAILAELQKNLGQTNAPTTII